METITFSNVRNNFSKTMDKICDDHTPIIVTRQASQPIIMMSLEDYNAIEETIYLLKYPKNAKRLRKALRDIKKEKYTKRELIES